MTALVVVVAVSAIVLAAYAAEKIRTYTPTTPRGHKHPTAARVGYGIGMLAAWLVQAAALALIFLLVLR